MVHIILLRTVYEKKTQHRSLAIGNIFKPTYVIKILIANPYEAVFNMYGMLPNEAGCQATTILCMCKQ